MDYYLIIHTTADQYYLALAHNTALIDYRYDAKTHVSKNIFLQLDQLLQKHQLTFNSLSCIAAPQGPGSFTTLRAILTCVNGLAYATHKPLIGFNPLSLLAHEHAQEQHYTLALSNACNNDVYYSLVYNKQEIALGCSNIETLVTRISQEYTDHPITVLGSGVEIYKKNIEPYCTIPSCYPRDVSLEYCVAYISQQWQQHHYSFELKPIYLKELAY